MLGVLVLVPVLILATVAVWLWAEGMGTAAPDTGAGAADGLWLGHAWVDGRRDQSDVDTLAARVRSTGNHDLFVHTGPLADDGSLDPALRPDARWLTTALHLALPGVRVQSWLGDTVGRDGLDPADPATRDRIVTSAREVLDDGFDGVHLDLEPLADGTAGFLTLLSSVHELTLARHAVLSVAAHQLEPLPGLLGPARWLLGKPHFWSTGYLREVATRVDEVAIMAYDTGVPLETAYTGYVHVQTELALEAVPPRVTLLIGLPAYHTDEPGHTDAETVAAAVKGVRMALGGLTTRPFGVSMYADFSATPEDWHAYLTGWVHA
ncbi:membrane protein [Amycolatopsis acidiphila]|nr:membrane protein [Amycolatopsis acidiphila]